MPRLLHHDERLTSFEDSPRALPRVLQGNPIQQKIGLGGAGGILVVCSVVLIQLQ